MKMIGLVERSDMRLLQPRSVAARPRLSRRVGRPAKKRALRKPFLWWTGVDNDPPPRPRRVAPQSRGPWARPEEAWIPARPFRAVREGGLSLRALRRCGRSQGSLHFPEKSP